MGRRARSLGPWPTASALLRTMLGALDPIEVVDVGANPIEGEVPYRRLLNLGLCNVTGFEPQQGPYKALLASASDRETYHPVALGAGGAGTLHLFQHSGFTSLFPVDRAVARMLGFGRPTRSAGTRPIETRTLDQIEGLPQIDYLKIDVQGAETAIIAGAHVRLADAVLVQTEVRFVPLYSGEPGFAGIDLELRSQGFMFRDFVFLKRVHLNSPNSGGLRHSEKRQVVDGDAFYVRDLSDLSRVTVDQLRRLALLADTVMEDPGLAIFCLDALTDQGHAPKDAGRAYLDALPDTHRAVAAQ